MGGAHLLCQDYASAGHVGGKAFAMLSDGCSGADEKGRVPDVASGFPYTDWGARLFVNAARKRLGSLAEGGFPEVPLALELLGQASVLGIPEMALDATLMSIVETPGGSLVVHRVADGVLATIDARGRIWYETLAFGRGMPRYLSYMGSEERHARLLAPCGDPQDFLAGTVEVTSNLWTPGDGWGPQLRKQQTFGESTPFYRTDFLQAHPDDGDERVVVAVVMSDGVESFFDEDNEEVALETVLPELLSFKNLTGRFAVRRCRRFLDKTCAERKWKHADDFSMAAVAVSPGDP